MLVDQKADDKTCDWVAKDDYRNWEGGVWGAAVVIYFLMSLLVLVM